MASYNDAYWKSLVTLLYVSDLPWQTVDKHSLHAAVPMRQSTEEVGLSRLSLGSLVDSNCCKAIIRCHIQLRRQIFSPQKSPLLHFSCNCCQSEQLIASSLAVQYKLIICHNNRVGLGRLFGNNRYSGESGRNSRSKVWTQVTWASLWFRIAIVFTVVYYIWSGFMRGIRVWVTGWTLRVQWYWLTKIHVEQLQRSVDSMCAESTRADIAFLPCFLMLPLHKVFGNSWE